jgi:hypothetical protein
VGLVVIAMSMVFGAGRAAACSCIGLEYLVQNEAEFPIEAAFAGTVTAVPTIDYSVPVVTWSFRIDRVYRGDVGNVGDTIDVRSSASGASCGFEYMTVGDRRDIALQQDGGEWTSGLCSQGAVGTLAPLAGASTTVPPPDTTSATPPTIETTTSGPSETTTSSTPDEGSVTISSDEPTGNEGGSSGLAMGAGAIGATTLIAGAMIVVRRRQNGVASD